MDIQWRDIPGFEGWYQVSDTGLVKRVRAGKGATSGKLLNAHSKSGYPMVQLWVNNKSKPFSVHRLVLLAFIGARPSGMVINHKNGVKDDNRLENLEYCTQKQNVNHAINVLEIKPNHAVLGEKHGNAKLTDAKVYEIRQLYADGNPCSEIAQKFDVSQQTIYRIAKRKQWSHLPIKVVTK